MENWNWTKIFLLFSFIIFLGSLLLRQESAITQDLGRHLRLGEMIVEGGPPNGEASDLRKCALYSNCLTYTYPDYPFINHHWGSEVVFFVTHKLAGFEGIIILKTLVLGATFLITVLHASQKQAQNSKLKSPARLATRSVAGRQNQSLKLKTGVAIALVFFSVQMMADRLTTRPEIFGYLFFSLVFLILSRSNIKCYITFFVLPIIMLLWVNLHISFIFGLILIWLWAGCKILNTEFRILNHKPRSAKLSAIQNSLSVAATPHMPALPTAKPLQAGALQAGVFGIQNLKFLFIPLLSTLATLLNPSGLRGTLMPLSILKDYGYTIVENMTPFFLTAFKPQPEYWIYAIILAVAIVLFIFSPAKKNPFHLLTFLTFSLFPLTAVRHLPFFALIMPPVLTTSLYGVLKGSALRRKAEPYPILTAGCLFLAAFTNPVPLAYGKLPPIDLTIDSRHNSAIEFVKQNNLKGSMWNNYDIGSFLEWAIPQRPTFVDGRPEAFPVGFFRQTYIPMQENKEVWDRAIAGYDIQWTFVALTDATPWFIKWWKMIQNHPAWRIVYIDNFSAVLVKINGRNNLVEPQGKAKLLETVNLD